MMAGNPSRWSMHPPSQFQPSSSSSSSSSHQFLAGSSSLPFSSLLDHQELPHHQSWSQLLLSGLSGEEEEEEEEDRHGLNNFRHKTLENWGDQILNSPYSRLPVFSETIKQEISQNNSNLYGNGDDEFQTQTRPTWSHNHHHRHQTMPVSSPRSCITSLSSNTLDFSYTNNKPDGRNQHPDQSSEVQGERNSVFPEDPGQLLNDICLKRKGGPNLQDNQDKSRDLRSRGLCLVPVSCTQHVGSDNGADYWAPAIGEGL